jgi:uncharacterized protein DUF4113
MRGLLFRPGPRYGLGPAASAALFAGIHEPCDEALVAVIDRLNRDYGRDTVMVGAARLDKECHKRREWKPTALATAAGEEVGGK